MIKSSKSYHTLKNQIQLSLDFVLLACHSIPALNGYMKAVEGGEVSKIPDPDIFKTPTEHSRLKEIIPTYKKTLGRFLVLSSFSYFESYTSDVIEELFLLNGGIDNLLEISKNKREDDFIKNALLNDKAKTLREPKDKSKSLKYKKIIDDLEDLDYKFPLYLLSYFGLCQLRDQPGSMKSKDIPDIMEKAFGVNITEDEKKFFADIRDLRNDIAHAKKGVEVDLRKAIKMNKFLRDFAIKIDQHLVKNFFVIESAT
jgi:hypothetical protein